MPERPNPAAAVEEGRTVVVVDGIYRDSVALVLSAGGGVVQVQIAGVPEPVILPAASVRSTRTNPVMIVQRPKL